MAKVWLLIIDPKITPKIMGFVEKLHAHTGGKFTKKDGDGIDLLESQEILRIYGASKIEKGDFVYLCVKPFITPPSSPEDKDAINIGGGIYARLQKAGNESYVYTFKERYMYKSMYKTYLSTLPFVPVLFEEDFSEGLLLLGEKN